MPKWAKSLTIYRPEGEGFVRDTQNNMPTAAGLSSSSSGLSPWSNLQCLFSTWFESESDWHRRLEFASGSSLAVYGPLSAWDRIVEIYPVETDLKPAMIMLVLEDKKKQSLAEMGWNSVWKPRRPLMTGCVSLKRTIRDAGLSWRLCWWELTEKMPLYARYDKNSITSLFLIWRMQAVKPWILFASFVRSRGLLLYYGCWSQCQGSLFRKTWNICQEILGQHYRLIVSKTKDLSQMIAVKTCGKYWAGGMLF